MLLIAQDCSHGESWKWLILLDCFLRPFCSVKMYESPVVAALAESSNIAMPPALFLKQTGLLDQMRREILCEGDSLLQTDTTSASVRGNEVVTASINLMTQLYEQVDTSTSTRATAGACAAATNAGWAGRQDGRATGSLIAHLANFFVCSVTDPIFLSLLVFIQGNGRFAGAGPHRSGRDRFRE